MHLLQRGHDYVFPKRSNNGIFTKLRRLHLQNLRAVIVCVIVRMENRERPEDLIHRATEMVEPHFVAIRQWNRGGREREMPERDLNSFVPCSGKQILIGPRHRRV